MTRHLNWSTVFFKLSQPPTPNMSVGPGGMGPSNLNDNMATGPPPSAMMQSQMSNGEKMLFYR